MINTTRKPLREIGPHALIPREEVAEARKRSAARRYLRKMGVPLRMRLSSARTEDLTFLCRLVRLKQKAAQS